VLWVPIFESVAEHYVRRREALRGTLLFALSPFTLLFTTVAYSEGLFLLLTLVTWRLYLDRRYFTASLLAAFAALIRIPGFLIVLPMAVCLVSSQGRGDRVKGVLMGVPTAFVLLLWAGFTGLSTGDLLALFHNSEWSGMYTLPVYLANVLPSGGLAALNFPVSYLDIHWLLLIFIWGSLLISPFLIWKLRALDRGLFIYCLVYMAGVLAFGAVVSLPRFVAVLFPMWLPIAGLIGIRKWTPLLAAALSVAVCLILWVGFISGVFVG
jgi:hypothetical protein